MFYVLLCLFYFISFFFFLLGCISSIMVLLPASPEKENTVCILADTEIHILISESLYTPLFYFQNI